MQARFPSLFTGMYPSYVMTPCSGAILHMALPAWVEELERDFDNVRSSARNLQKKSRQSDSSVLRQVQPQDSTPLTWHSSSRIASLWIQGISSASSDYECCDLNSPTLSSIRHTSVRARTTWCSNPADRCQCCPASSFSLRRLVSV